MSIIIVLIAICLVVQLLAYIPRPEKIIRLEICTFNCAPDFELFCFSGVLLS